MKNLLLCLMVCLFSSSLVYGQRVLVNFENINQLIPGECFGTGGTDGPAIGNCVEIVANPDQTGNTSDSVASFIEPNTGETWMGVFFDVDTANYAPLVFAGDSSQLCMDAWAPVSAGVTLKLENPGNGNFAYEPPTPLALSATNAWETVCQDYAGTAADGQVITRVVVFFNIGSVPASETTYYWDKLEQMGATGIGGVKFGGFLKAYPNPVTNVLRIADDFTVPHTFVVSDLTGREVLRVENTLEGTLNVANLINGAYFLRAINQHTDEIRTTRFLKN